MRDLKIILPILVVIAFVIAGVFQVYKSQTSIKKTAQSASPAPSPEKFPTAQESMAATSSSVLAASQPATGSDTQKIANIGIFVDSPQPQSKVTSPLKAIGYANALGNIQINVKDGNGNQLGSITTTACLGYDACPFETSVFFNASSTPTGSIDIYNPSTFDGSPNYFQTIPVTF